MKATPYVIGLTGGIGSGKSTVAALLATRGADVVDADAIARACTAPGGAAIEDIRRGLGASFIAPDGGLDRARMRAQAFQDADLRTRLEAIVHPIVRASIEEAMRSTRAQVVVLDIPLLVESSHWRDLVDAVWVVDCEPATQVARVMARSGWTEQAVRDVIAAQATREQRLAVADLVIPNGQTQNLDGLTQLVTRNAQALGL